MITPNMRMRPMKGTRPRSQNADDNQDKAIAAAMRAEPKSQAENLMIVDLLRNDLARLSKAGSVTVPELFTLETYPTLHQMTSQVSAQLRTGLSWQDIFKGGVKAKGGIDAAASGHNEYTGEAGQQAGYCEGDCNDAIGLDAHQSHHLEIQ